MTCASHRFDSPLRARHEEFARVESARREAMVASRQSAEAQARPVQIAWISWGETAEVVASYDCVETEYAAIRRGAALCDQPQRATIEVRGSDRIAFLNRMLTQELKGMTSGTVRQSFWLNRKGRIEADLLLCELGDRMLIDAAGSVGATTASALNGFVFGEDVQVADVSAAQYRLAVHGPHAIHLLEQAGASGESLAPLASDLNCVATKVGGVECIVARRDLCGVCGLELFVSREHALQLWSAMLSVSDLLQGGQRRGRPCGWHALNIARIEGGTPLFEIDFSTSSLPHETGLISRRVSFTKGCYLGQEVVARMQSLGKPKQVIRAVRMWDEALLADGDQVHVLQESGAAGDPIGVITSSTMSPMHAAACIGFATVRTSHAADGTVVLVNIAHGGVGMQRASLRENLGDFTLLLGDNTPGDAVGQQ